MNDSIDLDEFRDHLFHQVLDCGTVVHWVNGDPNSVNHRGVPWAYTVGRTLQGEPELLVTGKNSRDSRRILQEQIGDLCVHPGLFLDEASGSGLSFIPAEPGFLTGAVAMFGNTFTALQVVWAGLGEQPLHPLGGTILTDPYGDRP